MSALLPLSFDSVEKREVGVSELWVYSVSLWLKKGLRRKCGVLFKQISSARSEMGLVCP